MTTVAEHEGGMKRGDLDNPNRIIFSEKFACPVSGFTIPEIEPRLFSFNNPYGACPVCDGLGTERVDRPGPGRPRRHAVAPRERHRAVGQDLVALLPADAGGARPPLQLLDRHALARSCREKVRDVILYGTGEEEVTFHYDDGLRAYKTTKTFEGVIPNLERRWKETDSAWMREEIERYQSAKPCEACHG